MYDKVELVLDAAYIDGYDWHEVVERLKSNWILLGKGSTKDNDEGYYWTGRHIGRIDISRRGVLFMGSIPKFMNGHNIYTLSLDEIGQFVRRLSDILGVPMQYAVVKELEFAHNFEMSQPPMIYLQKLGGMRKFKVSKIGETVYMETTLEKIKFYDKIREAKRKRELPKDRTGLPENLLRYEVTFKEKRLKELFKDGLTAGELYSKRVFWTLVAEWFSYFESVEKLPKGYLDIKFDDFKTVADFVNWCICVANGGQNMAYYMKYVLFKNRASKNDGKNRLHYNIQKKIRQALKWGEIHLPASDSISELINKMEQYLTWLLEKSADGLSVSEEQSLFHTIQWAASFLIPKTSPLLARYSQKRILCGQCIRLYKNNGLYAPIRGWAIPVSDIQH